MVLGMVVKLTTKQVAENWNLIKEALSAAPPLIGELDGKYHRTLESMLNGFYQCWFAFNSPEDDRPELCLITGYHHDALSGNKNLLLYLVYSYGNLNKELVARCVVTIKRYAKSQQCTQIVGYTNTNQWDKLVEVLGGDISYKFFAVPVGG